MQDLLKIKWVNRINNYAIPVVLFRSSNPKGHVMYCHGFTLFLTKVVNLNSAHGKVYSIQHCMIKFVSGVKHHNHNPTLHQLLNIALYICFVDFHHGWRYC